MEILRDLQTRRFWRHLALNFFAGIGVIAVFIELLAFVLPDIDSADRSMIAILVPLAATIFALVRSWPRPIMQTYGSPNVTIKVVKGNLLTRTEHLVIGTCDTFDTLTPTVISATSLQGQALEILFGSDIPELDRQLADALRDHVPIESIQKPGKQDRYALGTVATVKQGPRLLFFLAYTSMNEHNEARTSVDQIWKALASLWREVSRRGNGGAVAIPVIGLGLSRMGQILPAQDSIRFIALSYILASRLERFCDELFIVVRPEEYERLDRLEIQSFLASLKRS